MRPRVVLPRWSRIVSLYVENPLMVVRAQATKRNVMTRNYVSGVITPYVKSTTLAKADGHVK